MNTDIKQTEENKQTKANIKTVKKLPLFLCIPVICLLIAYLTGVFYYQNHFVNGTIIDQVNVSGMTIEDLEAQIQDYTLRVIQRQANGTTLEEEIQGTNIELSYSSTKPFQDILNTQNKWLWFVNQEDTHEIEDLITYNENSLAAEIKNLKGFNKDFVTAPKNAYITDYDSEKGFQIVEEVPGNKLNPNKTQEAIETAVEELSPEVNLDEADCYEKPAITVENEALKNTFAQLKSYAETTITYSFGSQKEVLDGVAISEWLDIEGTQVTLDNSKVKEYVDSLRKKYDTVFRPRTFQTSYGSEITIKNGDYGWWMDTEQETAELMEMIEQGESGERTPVYRQTAASYDTPDYGDTYVEINLTAQHLFLYKNGQMILESDFVSGNVSRGYTTPGGIFGLTYKERDATLKGETYRTPVSFWMPFNNNIGMHDATWRRDFGKNIYLTNGSHGCINLPYSVAKEIYGHIEKGTPVICYYLPGTEYIPEPEMSIDPNASEESITENTPQQDLSPPEETSPEPAPQEAIE